MAAPISTVSMEHNSSDIKQAQSEPSSLAVQESSNSQTNKIVNSKQTRTSLNGSKKIPVPPSSSLSSKHNVKKSSSISSKTTKNMKGVSYLKNQKNVEEVKSELAHKENLPEKILHVIERISEKKSLEPTVVCDTTNTSSASPSSSRDKSLKLANKQISNPGSLVSSRKSFRQAGRGIGLTISLPSSPLSSGYKSKRYKQHKANSASSSLSSSSLSASPISPSNSPLGKQNVATSMSNKTGHENVKVGYRPKTKAIVGAGYKVIPAWKLTFRRGQLIEHQPRSNIPRRLNTRSAGLLNESNYVKLKSGKVVSRQQLLEGSKRRSLRRKDVDGSKMYRSRLGPEQVVLRRKDVDGSKMYRSRLGPEQVVLRHQNLERKKVTRRLYNNVIEETASKLAELRKSNVKALVGAFETVISLDLQ